MPACLELENEHYGIVVFTLLFPVVLDPLLKTFPRTHYFFLVAVAEINAWHIFFAIFFCIFSPKIAKKNWVLIDPNFPIFSHFCHFKHFLKILNFLKMTPSCISIWFVLRFFFPFLQILCSKNAHFCTFCALVFFCGSHSPEVRHAGSHALRTHSPS